MSEPEPVAVRCAWCDWHVWVELKPDNVSEMLRACNLLAAHVGGIHQRTVQEFAEAIAVEEQT